MAKIRVFIADDHSIVRSGIRLLLSSQEDMEVVGEAEDGVEAVKQARALNPDVVLMDIAMKGLNGLEATKQIRETNPEVKILALTMHENERYFFEAIRAGALGYVLKGADPSDLFEAIRAVHKGQAYLSPPITKTLLDDYMKRAKAGKEKEIYDGLTEREREVLRLLAQGLTTREIAAALYISPNTVERHKANAMDKLGLRNRAELIKYSISKGLIKLDETP